MCIRDRHDERAELREGDGVFGLGEGADREAHQNPRRREQGLDEDVGLAGTVTTLPAQRFEPSRPRLGLVMHGAIIA